MDQRDARKIMKKLFGAALLICTFAGTANAITVWEIRRACGSDGTTYCPKASYGDPMKACLNKNFKKLTPNCKAVMKRINAGEKVKLF
jgi:uncharacterized GH25 family protein